MLPNCLPTWFFPICLLIFLVGIPIIYKYTTKLDTSNHPINNDSTNKTQSKIQNEKAPSTKGSGKYSLLDIFKKYSGWNWIHRKAQRLYFKIFINLVHKFEPNSLDHTRSIISKKLDDICKYVESAEVEVVRVNLENSYLHDTIDELKKARSALIEELSGGSDLLNIEFEVWQSTIQTLDFLINERIRLLALVDTAVTFSGSEEGSIKLENLLKENIRLKQQIDNNQNSKTEEIIAFREVIRSLEDAKQDLNRNVLQLTYEKSSLESEFLKNRDILTRTRSEKLEALENLEKTTNELQRVRSYLIESGQESHDLKTQIKESNNNYKIEISNLRSQMAKSLHDQNKIYDQKVSDLQSLISDKDSDLREFSLQNRDLEKTIEAREELIEELISEEYDVELIEASSDRGGSYGEPRNLRGSIYAALDFCIYEDYSLLRDTIDYFEDFGDHDDDRTDDWTDSNEMT